ncbi:NAD(P)-dependent oxidoreductase [Phaeobacter sp. J2-8]|uniref:NAD-dependent epimerase/dehydratase family protein n=1 Tax=Phaeobacter sp. J2-8 TaxID=2931394 RepID=UPI001FD2A4C4|nr:NAD(P)-dependent oxidoreductase [Phaeobacter sp. J2-8]MCJ7873570.1 NAD(P)-dependent oxidoreductase [Phaeobacter sp. J2-8]
MTDILSPALFPEHFRDVAHLEDFMSIPTQGVIDDLNALEGDIMILGVGGKIGVTMARMAKKAAPDKRVIGVSRFSEAGVEDRLNAWGIETIRCDLLDRDAVNALPKVANVIYMAGLKFDAAGREDFLWAMNTIAPQITAEAFRDSRIVSFSTIHVYPWSNPLHGGVTETCPPHARPGEYANSVVGRERTFQYFSRKYDTPGRIMRFVYAIDPRYGVMQEVAQWVKDGTPIPLDTGHVNIMWQGDANAQFLRTLAHCDTPASAINIGGPETVSVRYLANRFGAALGVEPVFEGAEADNCLLVNCDKANGIFGNPVVPMDAMIGWVTEWVKSGKPVHGKPSKFQVRTGSF